MPLDTRYVTGAGLKWGITLLPMAELNLVNERDLEAAFDHSRRDGIPSQTGRIVDAQLLHQALPVLLDRLDANAQFGCDLFVRFAFGNELQGLDFP